MFSLLTLLDDVATTLDDVAVMTKVAMKKTSALMSDDLAVNAGVVDGVNPDRELPMVKAIFLGSLLNKLICIVGALIILAVYPPLLRWILMMGGVYLCYEGAHKVWEKITGHQENSKKSLSEKEKVKGAIKTDLILSIEIIVIAKTAVRGTFLQQTISLIVVGIAASILIYGLVAFLVKLDDFGLYLIKKGFKKTGSRLVFSMPILMKGLGILGTTAMFLVGGGIFNHQFHLHPYAPELIQNLLLGLLIGLISLIPIFLFKKIKLN
jgi:hypothetical protein